LARAIVVTPSGKALPTAITVNPRKVLFNLLNMPRNYKISIRIPHATYVHTRAPIVANIYSKI